MDIAEKYNNSIESAEFREVCGILASEIQTGLVGAQIKLWYKIPVWFIGDNPIVGYDITKHKGINLLFWSGQVFSEPGLEPEGSFKAAQIKYMTVQDIDKLKLNKWLIESSQKIYNYKDIRKNKGKLELQ